MTGDGTAVVDCEGIVGELRLGNHLVRDGRLRSLPRRLARLWWTENACCTGVLRAGAAVHTGPSLVVRTSSPIQRVRDRPETCRAAQGMGNTVRREEGKWGWRPQSRDL